MQLTGEPLIDDNLGLITQLCIRSWRALPSSAKFLYDIEDLVSGAVMQVYKQRSRYKPKRAKSSTFVHHIVTNYCIDIQRKVTRRLDLMYNEEALATASCNDRPVLEAQQIFERLVEHSSSGLRRCLANFAKEPVRLSACDLAELRYLVMHLGIKPYEMRLILTHVL